MYFGKEQCFGELNLLVFSQRLIHPFTAKLYDNSQQFALLHIILTSQSDAFSPGDAAQVCEIKGNEFSCPTADASINATCDRDIWHTKRLVEKGNFFDQAGTISDHAFSIYNTYN